MPKPKPDVRFIVNLKSESSDYLIFTAHAAIMEGRGPCFPQYSDEPGYELVDLEARAQLDAHSTSMYGWRAEFKPFTVDKAKAESMLKVLRLIDKRLDALAERFGSPQDLADYMARLAEALGATERQCFARHVKGDQDMNGTGYRWMDTDYLRHHISTEVTRWRVVKGLVAA